MKSDGFLCAGDGGDGNPSATRQQSGGDGGESKIISLPEVNLGHGRQHTGMGGFGVNGGQDGKDGALIVEPDIISLAGEDTELVGGNIVIFGGDDWVLGLSNLSPGAIQAPKSITLAVGANSVVDLQDNNGPFWKPMTASLSPAMMSV